MAISIYIYTNNQEYHTYIYIYIVLRYFLSFTYSENTIVVECCSVAVILWGTF